MSLSRAPSTTVLGAATLFVTNCTATSPLNSSAGSVWVQAAEKEWAGLVGKLDRFGRRLPRSPTDLGGGNSRARQPDRSGRHEGTYPTDLGLQHRGRQIWDIFPTSPTDLGVHRGSPTDLGGGRPSAAQPDRSGRSATWPLDLGRPGQQPDRFGIIPINKR